MTAAGHALAAYLFLAFAIGHAVASRRAEESARETTLTLYGDAARRGCARPDHADQDHGEDE